MIYMCTIDGGGESGWLWVSEGYGGVEGVWWTEEHVKNGIWVRWRGKSFMLEISEDEMGKVRIRVFKRGDEFLELAAKLRAELFVVCMRGLDGVDVDDSQSMLRAESEGGGLDATVTVGSMSGAMEGHDGGVTKKSNRLLSKHCGVVMFAKERGEDRVCGVGSVNEMFVGFLECKDVKVLGGGKLNGTSWGVVTALVPCCSTEGSGRREMRGGGVVIRWGGVRRKMSKR